MNVYPARYPVPTHFCSGLSHSEDCGFAVTECEEDEEGRLWAGNGGEYANTVSYCPFCGYEAKVKPSYSRHIVGPVIFLYRPTRPYSEDTVYTDYDMACNHVPHPSWLSRERLSCIYAEDGNIGAWFIYAVYTQTQGGHDRVEGYFATKTAAEEYAASFASPAEVRPLTLNLP